MEDLVKRLDCVRFQPFDGVVVYRDENGNKGDGTGDLTNGIGVYRIPSPIGFLCPIPERR